MAVWRLSLSSVFGEPVFARGLRSAFPHRLFASPHPRSALLLPSTAFPSRSDPDAIFRYRESAVRSRAPVSAIRGWSAAAVARTDIYAWEPSNLYIARF